MLVEGLLIERLLFHPRISESISTGLVLLLLGNTRGGADYIIQRCNLISTADANLNTNSVCLSKELQTSAGRGALLIQTPTSLLAGLHQDTRRY